MDEIRTHPWVTQNGHYCLISKEENCQEAIGEITEADLSSAIKQTSSIFTVVILTKILNLVESCLKV